MALTRVRKLATDGKLVNAEELMDALPDPIVVANQHGRIVQVNLSAEDFFNTPRISFLRMDLGDIFPTASPIFSLVSQALKTGNSIAEYGIELNTSHIAGQTVMVQVLLEHSGKVSL